MTARTFRLFVSSTFADLEAERNVLQESVFPRLQALCLAAGCHFQPIDLRWGISEEATLDQQTMRVCLEEIERCRKVTPRPNFIVLLGDRYGWRPPPPEIPAAEWAALVPHIPPAGRELAEAWYRLDANDLPPRYHLRPRSGRETEAAVWAPVEAELQATFAAAAGVLADPERRGFYQGSATEQEVAAGVPGAGVPGAGDTSGRVFCFFRTITGHPGTGSTPTFVEPEGPARHQLAELKEMLRRLLPGGVHEYATRWAGDGPGGEHLHRLGEDVHATLARAIALEIEQAGQPDPLAAEDEAHRAFAEERARFFTGRAGALRRVRDYLAGTGRRPLLVVGEPGSGKSALLARAAEDGARLPGRPEVIARFAGVTPGASTGPALLEELCRSLARRYGGGETAVPRSYPDLVAQFGSYLGLSTAERPLVVLLDGLDQLTEGQRADHLGWLPAVLPPHTRLVVSARPGEAAARAARKRPATITLRPMPVADGGRLLSAWLTARRRTLQPAQRRQVLRQFAVLGRPLWLRLAFEEACRWASYSEPAALAPEISGIVRGNMLARLEAEEQHGAVLTGHALGYLAAARRGLAEDEILELLSADPGVMADFRRRSPASPAASRLPAVLWSRLRSDLSPYLAERGADGALLLGFYHQEVADVAAVAYLGGGDGPRRHQALASYFRGLADPAGDGSWAAPGPRGLSELPYHLTRAADWDQLYQLLTDAVFLEQKARTVRTVELPGDDGEPVTWFRGVAELLDDLELAVREWPADEPGRRKALGALERALRHEAHVLERWPQLLWQQVHNRLQWAGDGAARILSRKREPGRAGGQEWLRTHIPPSESQALIRTLAGHDGPVLCCAVSPDGTRIVSAGLDGDVRLWDAGEGILAAVLRGHTERVHGCAFSPDGSWIVSASGDGTVRLWDAETGNPVRTLRGHDGAVYACEVSPDGTWIVSAGDDHTLRVWGAADGAALATLRGHTERVSGCAIAPGGSWLVSASADRTLRRWDTGSWEERATLAGHADAVECCAVSPDGAWIVSGGYENVLRVWDAATGREHMTLPWHSSWVQGCRFSRDGSLLVSASRDYTMRIWDTGQWAGRATLAGHTNWVNSATFTPGQSRVVSAGADGTLRLWDLSAASDTAVSRHTSYVQHCAIAPDRSFVVSGGWDGALKIWDAASGRERLALTADPVSVETCAVSSSGSWIASGGRDGSVKLWDTATGQRTNTMTAHTDWVLDCAISPDDSFVVSAGRDTMVSVWFPPGRDGADTAGGAGAAAGTVRTLTGHTGFVSTCAVSPAGDWIVSGCWGGLVKLWDPRSGAELGTLTGHTGTVQRCAVSPDGSWVVSASNDRTLKVWDVRARQELATLAGHEWSVYDCAVSPDGSWLVSASGDRTLKVWEVPTGRELATLRGHTGQVLYCAVTAAGRRIVSGDEDGAVRVWDARTGRQTAHLPVGAYLTCLAADPREPWVAFGTVGGDVQLAELAGWE